MAIDSTAVFTAVVDKAKTLGVFDRVNGHESPQAPNQGVICSFWIERYFPIPARSGLNRTSMLLTLTARIQTAAWAEPQDEVDPRVLAAADRLMQVYHDDYDVDEQVSNIDLLGAYWQFGLNCRAGYLRQSGDGGQAKVWRVMVVEIPLILNDVYEQVQ